MLKEKIHCSTPEGYFEGLRSRLLDIPSGEKARKPSAVQKVAPYLALAATFAIAFVLGGAILNRTASPDADQASDEEIIEYLLASDVSTLQLVDYLSYNE